MSANHIRDYIRKTNAVPQHVLNTFEHEQDIKDCADLCDKGKHLQLTKRPDPTTDMDYGNAIPGAMVPGEAIPGSEGVWVLRSGNRVVPVEDLADRLMQKWDSFFEQHKL